MHTLRRSILRRNIKYNKLLSVDNEWERNRAAAASAVVRRKTGVVPSPSGCERSRTDGEGRSVWSFWRKLPHSENKCMHPTRQGEQHNSNSPKVRRGTISHYQPFPLQVQLQHLDDCTRRWRRVKKVTKRRRYDFAQLVISTDTLRAADARLRRRLKDLWACGSTSVAAQ